MKKNILYRFLKDSEREIDIERNVFDGLRFVNVFTE